MTLLLGDCLEILPTLADNSVDMVLVDLPYGTTACKWDSVIPLDKLWEQYNRICKEDGAMVLTAAQPFTTFLAASNLDNFRYEWIWEKNKATGHLNAKKMPMKCHEHVLIFYRKLPVYNPQMTDGHKPMNAVSPKNNVPAPKVKRNYNHIENHLGNPGGSTIRYPRDVLHFPVTNNDDPKKFHPTQKPIPMIEYFIKTYTNPGEVVLDNCMGSGSTCIAAENLGRKFVGIEMTEEYYKKANEWIKEERSVRNSKITLDSFYENSNA